MIVPGRVVCWLSCLTRTPATGRRLLTRSGYADDRRLRSRMAIDGYAGKADSRWRTAVIR
jgi:hypothetical protein